MSVGNFAAAMYPETAYPEREDDDTLGVWDTTLKTTPFFLCQFVFHKVAKWMVQYCWIPKRMVL
jgi:hypothetical protein